VTEDTGGKVVVITGAGAGIGLDMAQAFHGAGAQVALGGLRQDTVERAAADLEGGRPSTM
jgi:NADP-dependent 3-hydroxy acid dehydrogenase YdfG